MTLIQSLPASIGLDVDQMRLLDTFRVKRNVIDYSGEVIDRESLAACIGAADDLVKRLRQWLAVNRKLDADILVIGTVSLLDVVEPSGTLRRGWDGNESGPDAAQRSREVN